MGEALGGSLALAGGRRVVVADQAAEGVFAGRRGEVAAPVDLVDDGCRRWRSGSTYHMPSGARSTAWKPCGVMSPRPCTSGRSTPCSRKVRISGNWAARPGSMIGESISRKSCSPPLGSGRARMTWERLAASLNSAGADATRAARPLWSTVTRRAALGAIIRSPSASWTLDGSTSAKSFGWAAAGSAAARDTRNRPIAKVALRCIGGTPARAGEGRRRTAVRPAQGPGLRLGIMKKRHPAPQPAARR